MPYRPEFREALTLLSRAIRSLMDKGYEPPILVGGAAVEFFTDGAITSGDFDLVTPYKAELEAALEPYGFEHIREPGVSTNAVINRRLGFAVQVVSGILMDGKASQDRIRLIELDGIGRLAIIPIEDLIADRMAQAYSVTPAREDMINQAVTLYRLADEIDERYLDKRIFEETAGDVDLEWLKGLL